MKISAAVPQEPAGSVVIWEFRNPFLIQVPNTGSIGDFAYVSEIGRSSKGHGSVLVRHDRSISELALSGFTSSRYGGGHIQTEEDCAPGKHEHRAA